MTSTERKLGLGNIYRFAVARGFAYHYLCDLIRFGRPMIGPPGTRTREMADAVAEELGKPFDEVWNGENEDDCPRAA